MSLHVSVKLTVKSVIVLCAARVEPLSWGMRVRIAMDVARGLDFLHNNPDNTVIYRDVKPANISLDEVTKVLLFTTFLAVKLDFE